jgi:hypothetical protein
LKQLYLVKLGLMISSSRVDNTVLGMIAAIHTKAQIFPRISFSATDMAVGSILVLVDAMQLQKTADDFVLNSPLFSGLERRE